MSNSKISTLTSATTPLGGTEVLPIVQSGATVKVLVSSLNSFAPAFSYYLNGAQTVSAATFTKVTLNTKTFDTNNNFDPTTNYRFTPTIAGYYQISALIGFNSTGTISRAFISIYKNGSVYVYGLDLPTIIYRAPASVLVYMNGSTDYLELYGWVNGSGTLSFISDSVNTFMTGVLVRGS
jgi:hypothetical protein